jgi:hypothetical protein
MFQKNTLILIISQWISFFGSKLHMLALPLIIYQKTGSTRLLALGFLAETLPWMILAPKLSVLLEKVNIKRLLIYSDIARAALCFILAFINYETYTFLLIMFLIGSFNSVYGTFRLKVLKSCIIKDELQSILSLTNSGIEVIQIAAPAIGGAVLALGILAKSLLVFDGITFIISAAILWWLEIKIEKSNHLSDSQQTGIVLGLKQLLKSKKLFDISVTEALRSLSEAFFLPILLVVIKERFHLGENYLGWAQCSMSIGALLMAVSFIKLKAPFYRDVGPGLSLLVLGLLQLLLLNGGPTNYFLFIASLIGAAMSFRQLSAEYMLIQNIPDESAGLLISIYNSLISSAYIAGYLLSAILSSYISTLVLAGILCVVGGIYQLFTLRRSYERVQTLS